MHRYHPRFHIVQADDLYSVRWSVFQTFTFHETSFTAVTAYQNTKVCLSLRTVISGMGVLWFIVFALPFTDYQAENRQQPLCQGIQRWGYELKKVSDCSEYLTLFVLSKRQFWMFGFPLPYIDVQTEVRLMLSGWLRGWTRWSGTQIKVVHQVRV